MSDARDRLVLVLDVGDLDRALGIASRLAPWFATVKVGFELYAEAGPAAFDALHAEGFKVFADMKLHDIPNTVARAARVLRPPGRRVPQLPCCGRSRHAPRRGRGLPRGRTRRPVTRRRSRSP